MPMALLPKPESPISALSRKVGTGFRPESVDCLDWGEFSRAMAFLIDFDAPAGTKNQPFRGSREVSASKIAVSRMKISISTNGHTSNFLYFAHHQYTYTTLTFINTEENHTILTLHLRSSATNELFRHMLPPCS